jgi:hypothetical protein
LTHNRQARAAPTRLELPKCSHGPSQARLCRLLKDFSGVFERFPHAPGERKSDQCPGDERLGIETPPADSMGALRPKSLAAHRAIDAHFFLNMPLRADRPDQRVANESRDEETGKNIKDQVVDMVARNALGHARVMQVIDDHRAHDPSRRRPTDGARRAGRRLPRKRR